MDESEEGVNRENVFNIPFLASRLKMAVHWLTSVKHMPTTFPLGFFGASTGEV